MSVLDISFSLRVVSHCSYSTAVCSFLPATRLLSFSVTFISGLFSACSYGTPLCPVHSPAAGWNIVGNWIVPFANSIHKSAHQAQSFTWLLKDPSTGDDEVSLLKPYDANSRLDHRLLTSRNGIGNGSRVYINS